MSAHLQVKKQVCIPKIQSIGPKPLYHTRQTTSVTSRYLFGIPRFHSRRNHVEGNLEKVLWIHWLEWLLDLSTPFMEFKSWVREVNDFLSSYVLVSRPDIYESACDLSLLSNTSRCMLGIQSIEITGRILSLVSSTSQVHFKDPIIRIGNLQQNAPLQKNVQPPLTQRTRKSTLTLRLRYQLRLQHNTKIPRFS